MPVKTATQIVGESIRRIQEDIRYIRQMANVMPEDKDQIHEMEHQLRQELKAEVEFAHELELDVSILV